MLRLIKRKIDNLLSDKKFSEILRGSVYSFWARILSAVLTLIASVIVARVYGVAATGTLAVVNSFLTLVAILTVMGTDTSILRLIPEHVVKYSATSAFRVYSKVQYAVIAVSIAVGAIIFAGLRLIGTEVFTKPQLITYLTLAATFVVFKSLVNLNTMAVRGLRLIKTFAAMQALPSLSLVIILLLLTFVSGHSGDPVYAQLGSIGIAAVAGVIIMDRTFRHRISPHDTVQSVTLQSISRISVPMFMSTSTQFVIAQTGVLILGVFRSEMEVGYYSIAVKLATLTAFVLAAINSVAAPNFSELYHRNRIDDLLYVARKSAKLIFWSVSPILLVLVVFGRPVLRMLYGPGFIAAYPAMVILVLGQFVNSVSGSTANFMNMTDNQNYYRNVMLIVAAANIALNFGLVPIIGIYGSAVASVLCIAAWNVWVLLFIKRRYGRTIGYLPFPHRRKAEGTVT